ncbi:MAG TPA: DUF3857 domain-containing protein [Terriglobales bacterium]|nr:DUF3857 domain-containing protein [Terriglobales bacterium]
MIRAAMSHFYQSRARFCLLALYVLIVSGCCLAQSTPNPFDRKFDELTQRWNSSDAPTKAVLLDQMHGLRDFVSDPARVSVQINRIAENWSETPLVRDDANWQRARIALHERRLDEARRLTDALGFVRDWTRTSSANCFPIKVAGTSSLTANALGSIVLHDRAAACVATAIYVSEPKDVALRFGANASVALFVNGNMVVPTEDAPEFAFDQRSVGVRLQPGWNILALEFDASSDERQFALRVTATTGGAIGVAADSSRISSAAHKTPLLHVSDLLEDAEENGVSAEGLDTLAELREVRGLGKDIEHLDAAAKRSPSVDRWVNVANACVEESCTFSALGRALALDPKSASANLALAVYYIDRGQLLKARELLQEVLNAEPDNFVAQKKLADVFALAGAPSAAKDQYRKLETRGNLPIWVKRELGLHYEAAGITGPATAFLNQAWRSNFDDTVTRAALQRLAQRRGDADVLMMLAQSAEALDPMNPAPKQNIAQVVGVPTQADNTVAYGDMKRHDAESATHVLNIRETSSIDADADYMVNAASLAKEARRSGQRYNSNVVTLADVTVERVQANGQNVVHAQQVFYMANDRGARDYRVRNVQYSHATQKLTVLGARIYKANGQVLDAEDQGETSIADTSISMYYDTRARALRFPNLEKGDVIELEYRIVPNSSTNPYGDYFGNLVTFQNGLPQKLRRYVLITPVGRKLNVIEERMPVRGVVSEAGGQVIRRWDVINMAPLASEPRGPSLTEVAPYVAVSTFADWNELGRWYADLITPQFNLDSELRDVLAGITKNATTELEKIHAIHEFVLRNTHYVAMEFGIYSYKPYPVTQVYARRFGDCKDKASLMIAMMRAVGVDAEMALVRTRKLGDVDERATALSVFNHAVAYIPKYDLWLDGTAEYAGSRGELPLDDQGAMALTVNLNGNSTLRRIPVTLPMQNYTHRVVRADIQDDGNILFRGSAYTRGEDAPGLRREYEIADRQRDTVRANLAQVYPSVQVDSVHVDGAQDIERDINVKFSGSLDKFSGQKQLQLASSWLPHQYVNSLAAAYTRTQQLQLPAPWTTEEEIHFTIPDGGKIDVLPADVRHETPFGTAVIRYELRGRELIVNTSVQFRKLRIEASEYPAFRQFCADVEKAFRQEVTLKLGS